MADVEKKAGRKPAANPRNVRVTFLVTPAEFDELKAAAQAGFEGNVSTMTRTLIFRAIGTLVAQAAETQIKE